MMMEQTKVDNREEILQIKQGTIIDSRYSIDDVAPIGRGGSGIVYKTKQVYCEDKSISSERAIKFFLYDQEHQGVGLVSFENFDYEIRNLTKLNHQNVLKVVDGGYYYCKETDTNILKVPYIVTDIVKGDNLETLLSEDDLDNNQKYTESEIFDLILEILNAIEYLHNQGFYHCDIAPKNIFIQTDQSNKMHAILGDLGAGHTLHSEITEQEMLTVIGTKQYMPDNVRAYKGKQVSYKEFSFFQPDWDIYSTVVTLIELLNKTRAYIGSKRTWHIDRLKEKLTSTCQYSSISEIIDDVKHHAPSASTIYNLSELSEASHEMVEKLIPCGSVFLSRRMKTITKSKAMLRLLNVPQLLEGAMTFPGANHTRYEHSLGTYELMRKAIVALLGNQFFTNSLSERNVILALLGALLSSLANYPYSYAIQEIRFADKTIYPSLDRREVFKRFLLKEDVEKKEKSLFELITELFNEYSISISEIEYVIFGMKEEKDTNLHILYLLLNSSIGVRVIDYLQRDSHHIGLSCNIDIDDLFESLAIEGNEFCVRQRGLSAVEEIIISRYWMFKRIYWSQPNRANAALLKYMFYRLYLECEEIEEIILNEAFYASKDVLMSIIRNTAQEKRLFDISAIIDFLLLKGEQQYKTVLVLDKGATYSSASHSCTAFAGLSYPKQFEIRKKLEKAVCEEYQINEEVETTEKSVILLIDMPEEHFENKTGVDIRIKNYNGNLVPLEQASGLVRGMSNNYVDHLRILRIYMRPDIFNYVKEVDLKKKKEDSPFKKSRTIDHFLNEELQRML